MTNSLISKITGQNDIDPAETREWIEALQAVLEHDGSERVHFLIEQLVAVTRHAGFDIPFSANTAYINTIPVAQQAQFPGDVDYRAQNSRLCALECDDDGVKGE